MIDSVGRNGIAVILAGIDCLLLFICRCPLAGTLVGDWE